MSNSVVKSTGVPIGTIISYGGLAINQVKLKAAGWLLCNGSYVNVEDFPDLYAAIGTSYGGNTKQFYLPYLVGTFLRGVDTTGEMDPDFASRTALQPGGNTGQSLDPVGSYEADQFGQHSHTYYPWVPGSMNMTNSGSAWQPPQQQISAETDLSGGSETRPKNVYVYYYIFCGVMESASD